MGEIEVGTGDAVETVETSPSVARQLAFETVDTTVVRSRVAGGVATWWHHTGENLLRVPSRRTAVPLRGTERRR